MLGIGYAASIGGVATLIGTPPNAIFAGVMEKTYGISISFLDWMMFALPLSLVMLFIVWFYLARVLFTRADMHLPGSKAMIREHIARLGPMSRQEMIVAAVFCCGRLAVDSAWLVSAGKRCRWSRIPPSRLPGRCCCS